jgi:hypothetical protein
MSLKQKWIQHLEKNNMSYNEHFVFAMFYGVNCCIAGFYLIVHSILPCFFSTAGSDLVERLSKEFKNRN